MFAATASNDLAAPVGLFHPDLVLTLAGTTPVSGRYRALGHRGREAEIVDVVEPLAQLPVPANGLDGQTFQGRRQLGEQVGVGP